MIDDKNRQLIIEAIKLTYDLNFLSSQGLYCHFDIYYRDEACAELKERSYASTTYADNTMEYYKYTHLRDLVKRSEFKKVWLVSTYSDGIIRVSDIMTDSFKVLVKKALHTTCFEDNIVINKNFIHFTSFIDFKIENGKFVKVNSVTAPTEEPDMEGE